MLLAEVGGTAMCPAQPLFFATAYGHGSPHDGGYLPPVEGEELGMVMKRLLTLSMVSVLALVLNAGPVHAGMYDLSTAGSSATINGALFTTTDRQSTGTGLIHTFVQVHADGTEQSYNTDAGKVLDSGSSATFNHSLLLSEVPVVSISGVDYREFLLDINEKSSNPYISLDRLQIYLRASGNYSGSVNGLGTPIYSLDTATKNNWILLDYRLNSGSGSGDMLAYIPNALFGLGSGNYVYLYSKFGCNKPSDDGFEEWAVRKCETPVVPVPAGVILGVLGLGAAGWKLRRFA
jgi:hypothetical protein